jgi:succinate dehydrogenase hydrophobic membrane anchor protein
MTNYTISSSNWLKQRISACFILFFTICLLSIIYFEFNHQMAFDIIYSTNNVLYQYPNILLPLLSINLICIYHGCLGMHVIIEDYIKNLSLRSKLIGLINFLSLISIIITILLISFILVTSLKFSYFNNSNSFSFIIIIINVISLLYLLFFSQKKGLSIIIKYFHKLPQTLLISTISWLIILIAMFYTGNIDYLVYSLSFCLILILFSYYRLLKFLGTQNPKYLIKITHFVTLVTIILIIVLLYLCLIVGGMVRISPSSFYIGITSFSSILVTYYFLLKDKELRKKHRFIFFVFSSIVLVTISKLLFFIMLSISFIRN